MAENDNKSLATLGIGNTPSFLKGEKADGFENMEKDDVQMPRIKLLQALSPEVSEEGSELKAGFMVHSADPSISFGKEVGFIPLGFFKSRMWWRDQKEGGGQECVALDGRNARSPKGKTVEDKPTSKCSECIYKEWNNEAEDEDDKKPKCTSYMNFPALVNGVPIALSFERTKLEAGRNLLTLAQLLGGGGHSIYAGKYRLKVKSDKNSAGQPYFNFVVESAGFVNEEEYKVCKQLAATFKDRRVQVDVDDNGPSPAVEKRDDL